ncbi:MAG: nuclear transport factor 2 family protein [Nevskiales bacterium]
MRQGCCLLLLLMSAPLANVWAATPAKPARDLSATVAALDGAVFDAYNRCDMDSFGGYFVADVEFYHDHGGMTGTRQQVVDNTRKYICGKVRRELVAGSLQVYPVKGYGAMEIGDHRFCELASGKCEGMARFAMIWQQKGDAWRITRVLSFDHHTAGSDAALHPVAADPLFDTVAALDGKLFDGYNHCDLKQFGDLVAADVEFYHDQGGLTQSRQKLVDSVHSNICGKVRRELVPGTLQVFPVKDFGAIETGNHRFCELTSGKCEGLASFIHVWKNDNGVWQLTRVLSYDHHPAPR